MDKTPIYLDYHSHAPMDPRALAAMVEAYSSADANPHSTHLHGGSAHRAVETARGHVATLLGARNSEIVFTSGATEANDLALSGMAGHLWRAGKRRIAVSAIEHASVLETARSLGERGWTVDVVPVRSNGQVDLDALDRLVGADTGLISIAWANHEIGVVQPMDAIAGIAAKNGALLHSDMAQIAGKLPASVSVLDLASVSAHKLGGPTGIGALYVSRRLRNRLEPRLHGGGQESGARSGTVAAPLCAGFGVACELAYHEMGQESVRVAQLRDALLARLLALPGSSPNGDETVRLPGNLNVRFVDVDGEALVLRLQDYVSVSTGSACSSKTLEPSHVLLAIGLTRQEAETSVRIGLGHGTTSEEVDRAATAIERAVEALRSTRRRS